ncbi:hypothetical protein [Pelagibacterium sp.]|uniref:hypothetical protein n=1 Tax=Pelagibacterium sp. TaxID=1967288 RepID=UPI003A9078FE
MPEETRSQRAARQRRNAAERARRYRERKKKEGSPEPRVVDAALSEAMSFWLAKTGALRRELDGLDGGLSIVALMKTARVILEREGYAVQPSAQAVADRLVHRPEHEDPYWIPSLRPRDRAEHGRPTKGGGEWSTSFDDILDLMDDV